jgi:hypothetical protein
MSVKMYPYISLYRVTDIEIYYTTVEISAMS